LNDYRQRLGEFRYRAAVALRGEGSVFDRLTALRAIEFDPHAGRKQQLDGLLTLLSHRLRRVPFYEDWSNIGDGATADDVVERLRLLPVLEKATVQSHAARLTVGGWRGRSYSKTTGGSTGRPVTIRKNAASLAQEMAATWLGYGWHGVHIGDPSIRFWGQPQGNLKRKLRYWAADTAMSRVTLSAFGYTRETLSRYVEIMTRFRPSFLYGYVSALEDLARHVLETGRSSPTLKCVITTSEVLTKPQRTLIQQAFEAPVVNEYGCGEVGPIAYECPKGSLHLMSSNHFIEILGKDDRPAPIGTPGSVVVTDLTNEVMPLIRYRVGDSASQGKDCVCGRAFPVLKDVLGREYDFVEAPDGRRFHGEFFMYLFEDLRGRDQRIGQFKVTQVGTRQLRVSLVVSERNDDSAKYNVIDEFGRRLPGFDVEVEHVEAIPRQPSGKMRVVENQLSRSTQRN